MTGIREPVSVVELEQDFCRLTYGTAPCGARLTPLVGHYSVFDAAIPANHRGDGNSVLLQDLNQRADLRGPGTWLEFTTPDDFTLPESYQNPSVRGTTEDHNGNPNLLRYIQIRTGNNNIRMEDGRHVDIALGAALWITVRVKQDHSKNTAFTLEGAIYRVNDYIASSTGGAMTPRAFADWIVANHPEPNPEIMLEVAIIDGRVDNFDRDALTIRNPDLDTPATGTRKCFNTFATCQDRGNFDDYTRLNDAGRDPEGINKIKLRFKFPTNGEVPGAGTVFPALRSVDSNPTILNPVGLSNDLSVLGRRASVSVRLSDFPWGDSIVDKYRAERVSGAAARDGTGYDPETRGTFWTKWMARNPFHEFRTLRIYEGTAGQTLEQMTVREYVVDRIDGPDNRGEVSIVAKDILKLADDDRALVPKPSNGTLNADLDESATAFKLMPKGIGDDEYPASGHVAIGDELLSFTRTPSPDGAPVDSDLGRPYAASSDTLTVARGQQFTEAEEHDEGAKVQLSYETSNTRIDRVIKGLLNDYAGIGDSFLDLAGWELEANLYLQAHTVSRLLGEPRGVASVLTELARLGVYVWWDERAQKVKLRSVRPEQSNIDMANALTDANAITIDSELIRKPDERVSQVFLYYGKINPLADDDDAANYDRIRLAADPNSEREIEYGDQRVKVIHSPWLDGGDSGLALSIITRILSRQRNVPVEMRITVNASDANRAKWTGDTVCVCSRLDTDDTGQPYERLWLIISAEEIRERGEIEFTLIPADYPEIPTPGGGRTTTRFCYVCPDDYPDFDSASDAQKADGGWISQNNGEIESGEPAYLIL